MRNYPNKYESFLAFLVKIGFPRPEKWVDSSFILNQSPKSCNKYLLGGKIVSFELNNRTGPKSGQNLRGSIKTNINQTQRHRFGKLHEDRTKETWYEFTYTLYFDICGVNHIRAIWKMDDQNQSLTLASDPRFKEIQRGHVESACIERLKKDHIAFN